MKYSISVNNGYIIAVIRGAEGDIGISQKEYEVFVDLFAYRPIAPDGYIYKLRADNREWEMVELPAVDPDEEAEPDDEAEPEDYEQALQQMGVDFSD